jgi:nitrite reductase/ring-hydroxylating ferredoxin subunit
VTELDRRTVLRGAGAVGAAVAGLPLLAACGSGSGSGGDSGTPSAPVTIATSAVAVHGGVIQDKVVVTQPTDGTFKAFSAICPHQACTVATVADDVITCPCHNSTFSAADGSHISGPAPRGLTPLTATVSGSDVVVT